MKKYAQITNIKAFLLGVVVTAIIITTIVPAIADQVQIFHNTVNVTVDGTRVVSEGQSFTLPNGDAVPYSISFRGTTYLPMREMGRLIGFDVDWDNATRTVVVTTEEAEPEVPGNNVDEETEPEAQQPAIPNDEFFEIIPSADAQLMFENREHFVMVLFDSQRESHLEELVEVRRVARVSRVKLFAVDVADLPSMTIHPEFARTSVPTTNHMMRPVVFYVLGLANLTVDPSPTSTARLTRDFNHFRDNYRPSTGGGGAGAYDITPNENMRRISLVELERRIASGNTFVLVYHSSIESFSHRLMTDVVYDAVLDSNRRVYILDGAEIIDPATGRRLQNDAWHWLNMHGINFPRFPIVYFVKDGLISPSGFPEIIEPSNSRTLENRIRDFFEEVDS